MSNVVQIEERSPEFIKDWIAALHDMVPPHLDGQANYGTYPTLGGCLAAAKAALRGHKLAVMQLVCPGEDAQPDRLVTRILHVSGQSMEDGGVPLYCQDRNNPQKLGSTITYARRYGLLAMMGVVGSEEEYITLSPTDDDGQAATPPDELPVSSGRFISATSTPPAADPEPKPTVIYENIEDTLTIDTNGMTWAKSEVKAMAGWLTTSDKQDWLSKNREKLGELKGEDMKAYAYLIVNVKSKEEELTNA